MNIRDSYLELPGVGSDEWFEPFLGRSAYFIIKCCIFLRRERKIQRDFSLPLPYIPITLK